LFKKLRRKIFLSAVDNKLVVMWECTVSLHWYGTVSGLNYVDKEQAGNLIKLQQISGRGNSKEGLIYEDSS